MITELQLGEITVDVVQKDIKNVHLSVYPPSGRVRISAPLRMTAETIRVFAISKIGWIKQQQAKLQNQDREPPREYLDRESHYVWGKRYLLEVIEDEAPLVLRPDLALLSSACVPARTTLRERRSSRAGIGTFSSVLHRLGSACGRQGSMSQ
jgi:predicted metal-dependent hydrolase